MNTDKKGAGILVLTSRETQTWHSPFSAELRRWRRARILDRYRHSAVASGLQEFILYDAFENYLLREIIAE